MLSQAFSSTLWDSWKVEFKISRASLCWDCIPNVQECWNGLLYHWNQARVRENGSYGTCCFYSFQAWPCPRVLLEINQARACSWNENGSSRLVPGSQVGKANCPREGATHLQKACISSWEPRKHNWGLKALWKGSFEPTAERKWSRLKPRVA